MADKKIKLYKVNEDGTLDKNSQLLPETDVESVKGLQETLDTKQGTINDLDSIRSGAEAGASAVQPSDLEEDLENYLSKEDYLENAKYDKVEKEIVIPNYAIDGNEYTLPTTYDFDKLTILSDNTTIYEDTENHIVIGTFSQDDFKVIWVNLEEASPFYSNQTNEWVIQESEADPVPYTEPITFTYNESCLKNEDYKELFSQILGIEPTIEHITIDRTLKEKNEDLPNWTYKETKETVLIPAELEEGEVYTFPTTYDKGISFEGKVPDAPFYNDTENNFSIGLREDDKDPLNVKISVWVDLKENPEDENAKHIYYLFANNGWYYYDETSSEDVAYTKEISFTYNSLYLENGCEDIMRQALGLLPHEETVIKKYTLKEELEESGDIKNWVYEEGTETIKEDLVNGNLYRPNLIIDDTTLPSVFGTTTFYDDSKNSISIEQYLTAGQYPNPGEHYIYYYINNIQYEYNVRYSNWGYYDNNLSQRVNITSKEQLPTFEYSDINATSEYLEVLKNILDTSKIISKKITVDNKFNEPLKDKTYGEDGVGFLDIPKWDNIPTTLNFPVTLYVDNTTSTTVRLFYMEGSGFGLMVEIDGTSYRIQSFGDDRGTSKNVWTPSKPQLINYSESLVNPTLTDVWACIYGEIVTTLEGKFNSLEPKLNSLYYTTDIPTSANTSGRLIIVLYNDESITKYDGYLYFLVEGDLSFYNTSSDNNGGGSLVIDEPIAQPSLG